MGSHCQITVHIIFGLQMRQKFINEEIRRYIAGIINDTGGQTVIVGGTYDHVHMLCQIPKDKSMADFVRTIKSFSSRWYNKRGFGIMHWQTGYAAFSVSKSNIDKVKDYILHQEEHHKMMTFEEEMIRYLDDPSAIAAWKKWVFHSDEEDVKD
ncbi:Transposase IS200 like protein [anaerobic digester metagenome]